jgi:hypothetical protein
MNGMTYLEILYCTLRPRWQQHFTVLVRLVQPEVRVPMNSLIMLPLLNLRYEKTDKVTLSLRYGQPDSLTLSPRYGQPD